MRWSWRRLTRTSEIQGTVVVAVVGCDIVVVVVVVVVDNCSP